MKVFIRFVLVGFILFVGALKGYAATSADKLRPPAPTAQNNPIKAVADASFLRIFPQNVHKGKGSSDAGSGLTIKQLIALKGLIGVFLGHTSTRERYITEGIEGLGTTRDEVFVRLDEFINDRIKELLKYNQIKEIHLGVGSERKNLTPEQEIEDIEKQLEVDLMHIALADLQKVNFNISYEPSIDIKSLEDKKLKAMVGQVHQFIYDWFAEKYGDGAIDSIWGKTLKVLFRGSVVTDEKKDNATPIMQVKVKTKKDKEIPGVHGVVFATSGKKVEGCLEIAYVVQEAAKRDGLQYVVMVNLKSVEDDDKDRTPPDEYVNQIYAALADDRLDRAFIIPEIAVPDVELKEWLALVAKAEAPAIVTEGSVLAEMKWEMVKQSALYSNNNLALTGIEARSTSLSTGHPTVEARFILKPKDGREITITGEAASGASAGNREALFLFDKDFAKKAEKQPDLLTDEMIEDIYGKNVDRKEALKRLKTNNEGKGVEITLWIARNVLIPELTEAIKEGRVDPVARYSVDRFMREHEKTHGGDERQKLKLTGANTTAFSTAAAKLGAAFNNMATWEFLAYRPDPKSLKINYESFEVLIPIAVLIEGGEHGHWNTDWQEYMVEVRGDSFEEITLKLKNITFALDKIMQKRGDKIGVGLEAGYLPTVKSNTEPIEMIVQAGRDAGYTPGKDFAIALDCASSEFYREYKGKYYYWYSVEGKNNEQVTLSSGKKIGKIEDIQEEGKQRAARFLLLTSEEQLEWAIDICKNPNYFISSVEDFFDQNDLWGNMMLTRTLQDKDFIARLPHEFQRKDGISHVADDISTSNIDVVRAGIDGGTVIVGSGEEAETLNFEKDTMSDILLKLNQAGTLQEVMELGEYLRSRGRTIDHSHRGKEPSKETIRADVALASTTYPSSRHDRTGAPARVKIKYGTIRKERAVVYDYLREAYATIKRKIEAAKIKTDANDAQAKAALEPEKPVVVTEVKEKIVENIPARFIDTGEIGPRDEKRVERAAEEALKEDKGVYSAVGGAHFDKLVNSAKEAQEIAQKTSGESKNLKVSVAKLSDKMIRVNWQFGEIYKVIRNLPASPDAIEKVVEVFNKMVVPLLEKSNLDLRIDEDYRFACELANKFFKDYGEVYETTSNFLSLKLLPAIRESLSTGINMQEIQNNKGHAWVLNSEFFKTAAAISALLKTTELLGDNFKIVLYGKPAAKVGDLIGNNENILVADTLDAAISQLESKNIKPDNITLARTYLATEDEEKIDPRIKQIVFPQDGISTVILAKLLRETFNISAVKNAFEDFYAEITKPEQGVVLIDGVYASTIQHMREEVKAGEPFYLPALTAHLGGDIEKTAESVRNFIFSD